MTLIYIIWWIIVFNALLFSIYSTYSNTLSAHASFIWFSLCLAILHVTSGCSSYMTLACAPTAGLQRSRCVLDSGLRFCQERDIEHHWTLFIHHGSVNLSSPWELIAGREGKRLPSTNNTLESCDWSEQCEAVFAVEKYVSDRDRVDRHRRYVCVREETGLWSTWARISFIDISRGDTCYFA